MKSKEKKKVNEIIKLEGFKVYIDAEWTSDNSPISVQALIEYPDGTEGRYIVINKKYVNDLDWSVLSQWTLENHTTLVFYDLGDDWNTVHALIKDYYLRKSGEGSMTKYYLSGEVYLFYSFQDLGFAFGWKNVESQLKSEISSKSRNKIEQKRSITGSLKIEDEDTCRINRWKIKDLSGLTNTGLKDFASSLGLSMADKDKLDDLKSSMDVALLTRTTIFLDYAIGDVLVLREIFSNFLNLVNDILSSTLKLPSKFLFTGSTLPLTTGTLVSETFTRYIYYHAQKNSQSVYYSFLKKNKKTQLPERKLGSNSAFQLAMWSLSFLKKSHGKRDEYQHIFKSLYETKGLDSVLEKSLEYGDVLSKWSQSPPFESMPFSGASIQTLAMGDTRSTALLNCLVSGGRANNEQPSEYFLKYILDVDLQSCYGSALTSFEFPIGLPTIVAFGPNETKMTLKDFVHQYGDELLPGLYKITVSGKLNFNQDLLFSKVTTFDKMRETLSNFNKKFEGENEDAVHFANDFVLARRECLNVVITEDILNVLKKTATPNEYKQILNLEVETAIFWKKSNKCNTCSEWIEKVIQTPGELVFDECDQSVSDTRSRFWYPLSLNEFIGRLVERRNQIKKESKLSHIISEKERLKGLQNILKLFINTLYGCLASPYFSIGNVVLADNITARARANVWMLCKALNLRQSITDGGIYTPMMVNFLKDGTSQRKPGLNTLSDICFLQKHRSIRVGPLHALNWALLFDNGGIFDMLKNIDSMVSDHVTSFWRQYGLSLTIPIEHKVQNTGLKGVYTNKANYVLLVYDSDTSQFSKKHYSLRGAHFDTGEFYPVGYHIHDQLLNGIEIISYDPTYESRVILKLGRWRVFQRSPTKDEEEKKIKPGQVYVRTIHFEFRDSHFPIYTIGDFLKRKRLNFTSPFYTLKPGETFSKLLQRMARMFMFKRGG